MVDTTHIDDRKFFENGPELFVEGILGKLDFTHVKVTDTADLEVLVYHLIRSFVRKPEHIESRGVRTVGVLRCVLERTMSRKSDALGTGAIAFRPLVDMLGAAACSETRVVWESHLAEASRRRTVQIPLKLTTLPQASRSSKSPKFWMT